MDVNDLKGLFAESSKRMKTSLDHLHHEFAGVRTGRASVNILDGVHVEAYGSKLPLNQVAGLSIPEPQMIVAQPFDPSQLGAVEKAIRSAGLGLNPQSDGKIVRIPLPALTEERRKELGKLVHREGEDAKVAIRNIRRDAIQHLKDLLKNGEVGEDQEKRAQDEVQKMTDKATADIDKLVAEKEKDLMAV
jgi:ribosome recycling factor